MGKRAGFQAQIRSHRVKRRRDDQPCFPSSSAQTQSRGVKRKRAAFSTAPSWGAQRARTAVRGPSPMALSGRGRRDWASLGDDGPACLIAELVLANDVADYVRFRAVCRAWRRCAVDPRSQGGLDARFLPRRWIMLDRAGAAAGPRCHRFLNVSSGECIRTDLPELADAAHALHAVTPEGLLLLLHRPTLVVRLLNPLTRQLTDLPPVTTLVTEQEERSRHGVRDDDDLRKHLCVRSGGLADASTVAVSLRFPMVVAVAKPGDERWTLVHDAARYVSATAPFAGRFYCALGSSIMVVDNSRLVTAVAPSFLAPPISESLHLVDNAGELMLVHRFTCRDDDAQGEKYKMDYRVYRVDLDAGALVPAKSFNGRAVFMGLGRAISVPAGAFPSVSADTIYLGSDCDEKTALNKIKAYNVADGSTQPYHRVKRIHIMQPYGIVDCISHCVKGSGRHLA